MIGLGALSLDFLKLNPMSTMQDLSAYGPMPAVCPEMISDPTSQFCYRKLTKQGLLTDLDIIDLDGMITPFVDHIVREIDGRKILSYGLGSYGYDVRLSEAEFYLFKTPVFIDDVVEADPKNFNKEDLLSKQELHCDDKRNTFFVMPPRSYGMAVVEECLNMPINVTALGLGKSSYARMGVNTHITPIEAGWRGHLTVAMSNSSPFPVRIYANEGLAQLLFFRSNDCRTTYEDRQGKYQDQGKTVTTVKV